jgi:hypothetical protein
MSSLESILSMTPRKAQITIPPKKAQKQTIVSILLRGYSLVAMSSIFSHHVCPRMGRYSLLKRNTFIAPFIFYHIKVFNPPQAPAGQTTAKQKARTFRFVLSWRRERDDAASLCLRHPSLRHSRGGLRAGRHATGMSAFSPLTHSGFESIFQNKKR